MEGTEHPHRVQIPPTNGWNWSKDAQQTTKLKQVNESGVGLIAAPQTAELTSIDYHSTLK